MDGEEHLHGQQPKAAASPRQRSNCPRITRMGANDCNVNVRGAWRSTDSTRKVFNTPWLTITLPTPTTLPLRVIRVFRGQPTPAPSSLATLRLGEKPPRAILTSPFVTSACFVVPLPALSRTEYRSAEYEYDFANQENESKMRKR